VAFAVGKDQQQHKFHYFFVISLTISFVCRGFRLQLLNTKLKQLSPILPASSSIDDADDGLRTDLWQQFLVRMRMKVKKQIAGNS
jgi:hypothetical protein